MSSRLRLVRNAGGPTAESAGALPFDAFFEQEAGPLFRRLCLVTGDRQEAEEVLQDAFLALFERWDRIQTMDDPVGYLYRTAFNRWKRLSRRTARQVRALVGAVDRMDEFANLDEKDAIDRALHALTPRQRAAIVLTEVLGYSSPEAARIMGVREGSVRALASYGRGTLRRMLETGDE